MQLLTFIMDSYASCLWKRIVIILDTVGGAVSTEAQFSVGPDMSSVKIEFYNRIWVKGK